MTCQDCISYEVCENGQWYETTCVHFKNKADFVEVVRCKDCNYQDECLQKVDCEYLNREIFYCSYGERRDT